MVSVAAVDRRSFDCAVHDNAVNCFAQDDTFIWAQILSATTGRGSLCYAIGASVAMPLPSLGFCSSDF